MSSPKTSQPTETEVTRTEQSQDALEEAATLSREESGDPVETNEPELLLGTVVDKKYRLVDVIGQGGMGTVYAALHTELGKKLALKVLNPKIASKPGNIARFKNEARIAGNIGHENIVQVTDMGSLESKAPYIVMERLQGQSLRELIAQSDTPIPINRAVAITSQILAGLVVVHGKKVVHRDLKPDNVFLAQNEHSEKDVVKLLDFGISKILDSELQMLELTRTGDILGTSYYMAPEQALGMKEIDHRVDLYAVGVILYELLTGERPFDSENFNALMIAIARHNPPPLTPKERRPEVPAELDAIVLRAIARERDDRFASAEEFLAAIEPFCSGQKVQTPTTGEEGELQNGRLPPEENAEARGGAQPRRRLPLPAAATIATAAVIALLALLLGMNPDDSRATADSHAAAALAPAAAAADGSVAHVDDAGLIAQVDQDAREQEASPAPENEPPLVRVEIRAHPPSARIRIDGELAEENPEVTRFPRSDRVLRIEASAPGFVRQGQSVALDEDHVVELRLRPLQRRRDPERRKNTITIPPYPGGAP